MDQQWKSTSSLHMDLISEILLRIPEKSVVRFRCVSKLWLSITTDPYFINLFETRNPRPSLLLCFKKDDELVVSSIPQHTFTLAQNSNKSYSSPHPTDPYRMKFSKCWKAFPPTPSVHGLICFQKSMTAIVWNPSTRKFLTLPKPSEIWKDVTVCLGYDAVEDKHKVIAMPSDRPYSICRVITLGSSQESWRSVEINQEHVTCFFNGFGQCINGVLYYLASINTTYVIMRFDVRSEKFDMILLPPFVYVDRLIIYEGRFACVHERDFTEKKGFTLSILEDAEENKWSTKHFLPPFSLHVLQNRFQLKDFSQAGEFIYEQYPVYESHDSWYVLFFDPLRNCFRRVSLEGIVDNKESLYTLHIFPNHFDTQTPL